MADQRSASRIGNFWSNLSPGQRLVVGGTIAAIVVAIIVGVVIASRARYSVLYSGLTPEEAGQVVEKLDQKKIPYKLAGGGGTILVPTGKVYSTRIELASEGFPRSGTVGFEIFDKGTFGMTDFLQKVNYRRALEGELAKTISQMEEVEGVRVHIVVPERTLFKEDQRPATASVVIKMNPARKLLRRQIEGIAYLVASSVEGLEPSRVTILDSRGNLMTRGFPDDEGQPADKLELTKSVESYLETKAQSLLDEVLGPGKAVVRVSAVLNFERIEKNIERYDPENAAIRSEERVESTDGEGGGRSETSVTNYELNRTVERIASEVGNIERLSIAVMVDGTYQEVTNERGETVRQFVPRSDEELQKIASIVKSAVGFDPQRNDYFEIASIAFDRTYLADEQKDMEKFMKMQFYLSLARKGAYLAGVALVLFVIVKLVKKTLAVIEASSTRRGLAVQVGEAGEVHTGERNRFTRKETPETVDEVLAMAVENPKDTANIIRSLMGEGE